MGVYCTAFREEGLNTERDRKMGFDKVKIKQICGIILYVALLMFTLLNIETVVKGIGLFFDIFKPFIVGAAVAFILNIPMKGMEEKFFGRWNGKSAKALKRPISLILSLLFVAAVIALVILAVVPQIGATLTMLGNKLPGFFEDVAEWLTEMATIYPALAEQFNEIATMEFDWNSILGTVGNFLKNGVTNMLSSTVNVASGIFGAVTSAVIGFVFSIYILLQKEKLQNQVCRVISAYLPERPGKIIGEVCRRLYVNFTNFICGQCLEAVILGSMFIIVMTIVGMPYAIMIGTLIAFTALIPIVGAFIGCGVGAFMILIDDPVKALWFVVLFLVLQQLEGNLIYPRVVGNSVGLPAIWVLVSVSVGGSLFGVVGMLSFIPLMSTLYSLLRDNVNSRNNKRVAVRAEVESQAADLQKAENEGEKAAE